MVVLMMLTAMVLFAYMNWDGWLTMSQFLEGKLHHFGFLHIEEEGSDFFFCDNVSDKFEYDTEGVDGFIELDGVVINQDGPQKLMPCCSAGCISDG